MREGVLFDFDGTLTARDTTADLLWWFVRRSGPQGWLAGLFALAAGPLWALPSLRQRLVSGVLWLATTGRPPGLTWLELRRFAIHLARSRILDPERLSLLRAHRRAGHEVLVVSASFAPPIAAVLAAEGLGEVEVLGSELTVAHCGLVMGSRCAGEEKVRRVQESSPGVRWVAAYGDSVEDLPMLALAGSPRLPRARRRWVVGGPARRSEALDPAASWPLSRGRQDHVVRLGGS